MDGLHATLPLLDAPRPERADAARNRRRVLDAAAALFAERGVDGIAWTPSRAPPASARARCSAASAIARACSSRCSTRRSAGSRTTSSTARRRSARAPPPGPPARVPRGLRRAARGARRDRPRLRAEQPGGAGCGPPPTRAGTSTRPCCCEQLRPDADAAALAHVLLAPLAADTWLALRRRRRPEPRGAHRARRRSSGRKRRGLRRARQRRAGTSPPDRGTPRRAAGPAAARSRLQPLAA